MKGGWSMGCKHERIKSVNCVLFCDICGEKLPAGWFTDKNTPAPDTGVKSPENGEKTASTKTRRKKA